MKIKKYINKKYINKGYLENLHEEFYSRNPIKYLVLDNFINPDFYNIVEEKLNSLNNFNIVDERKVSFLKNKTIVFDIPELVELYNFFISKDFEKFLMLIYRKKLQKYRKIKLNKNYKKDNLLDKSKLGIYQIYEKWDFLWWHTDIAKDMKMKECLDKWWYTEWDKCIVWKYDEVWAFIYYLYNSDNNWKEKYWWVLELWKVKNNKMIAYKKVFPLRNRLVLIKSSNYSYHRVTKVEKDNFRITLQDLLYKEWIKIWEEILY